MPQYKISRQTPLTVEIIKKLIDKHRMGDIARLNKLDNYYHAKNPILQRMKTDETLPCNNIAHPYASYITDTLTGYFMGQGVSYSSEIEEAADELKMILQYTDQQDENIELAKDMSIFGLAVELVYLDEDAQTRLKRLDPREIVLVYDDTLNEDLLYGIRYFECEDIESEEVYYRVQVYSDTKVMHYKSDANLSTLTFEAEAPHYFGSVPIVVFENNEEEIGDFEPVLSLIDAYDKMESDSLDDFDYFVDAYLCLSGLNADKDDVAAMKENRIILLDENSDAKWLTKQGSDTTIENVKNRLDRDIHKFSKTPDMSDTAFSGNASGVAIKYKTLPMENVVAIKERKFKRGLQRRIELIFNIAALKGSAFDWRAIDITFTRNLPSNDTEIANMVSTLSGKVSRETLLAQLPFVEDVEAEIQRLDKEQEANPFYDVRLGLNGEDQDESREEEEKDNKEEE